MTREDAIKNDDVPLMNFRATPQVAGREDGRYNRRPDFDEHSSNEIMSIAPSAANESVSVWRGLSRVFRIALDPRKLILAGLALLLLWCGEWGISRLPFGEDGIAVGPWRQLGPIPAWSALFEGVEGWTALFGTIVLAVDRVLTPLGPLLELAGLPFSAERSWSELALLWTRFFWSLAVWSVFGGAIARLAAVEFAKGERASLWSGVSFTLRRFLSLFSAPLLPIGAMLVLWGICALGGMLGYIPYVGQMLLALLWGLGFIFGLLIVLIALATCAGWPLMVAGIATESSDGFDGFSRSFSYLYGRPWLFGGCVLIALLMGGVLTLVVEQTAVLVATATTRTISTGDDDESWIITATRPNELIIPPNELSDQREAGPSDVLDLMVLISSSRRAAGFTYRLGEARGMAEGVVIVWHGLLFLLAAGFSMSFFWSASTVIYFLLRRVDDGTHLDEVWLETAADEEDLLPLAGIAATSQPVTERSHHPTVGEDESGGTR